MQSLRFAYDFVTFYSETTLPDNFDYKWQWTVPVLLLHPSKNIGWWLFQLFPLCYGDTFDVNFDFRLPFP